MAKINNINNEYASPTKDYNEQVYGNLPNEVPSGNPASAIRFQVQEMLKTVRTSMPGIVQETFERDEAVWVKVQPGLSSQLRNGDEFKLPIIIAPLCKLNIAGFEIDYPDPVQGDEVEIRFSDRSIQTFIKEAGVGVPKTVSILSINNGYVVPNAFSNVKRKRNANADPESFTISNENISIKMGTDGSYGIANENGSISLLDDGEITMVNNSGVSKLESGGRFVANGFTVDP